MHLTSKKALYFLNSSLLTFIIPTYNADHQQRWGIYLLIDLLLFLLYLFIYWADRPAVKCLIFISPPKKNTVCS